MGVSNLWLNIRVGKHHLQAGDPHWWSIRWRLNDYNVRNPPETFFEIFHLPWWC